MDETQVLLTGSTWRYIPFFAMTVWKYTFNPDGTGTSLYEHRDEGRYLSDFEVCDWTYTLRDAETLSIVFEDGSADEVKLSFSDCRVSSYTSGEEIYKDVYTKKLQCSRHLFPDSSAISFKNYELKYTEHLGYPRKELIDRGPQPEVKPFPEFPLDFTSFEPPEIKS